MKRGIVFAVLLSACATTPSGPATPVGWTQLRKDVRAEGANTGEVLRRFVESNQVSIASKEMALVHRAQLQLAKGAAVPAGSFARRLSAGQVEALMRPFLPMPLLPQQLSGEAIETLEARLDEAWDHPTTDAARTVADEVVMTAAPMRDEIDALLTINRDPARYLVELLKVPPEEGPKLVEQMKALRAVLYELALEADLLALASAKDAAPLEEFLVRYPTDPYAASVLFGLGLVLEEASPEEARKRFARIDAEFPDHPLAADARKKLSAAP